MSGDAVGNAGPSALVVAPNTSREGRRRTGDGFSRGCEGTGAMLNGIVAALWQPGEAAASIVGPR